MACSKGKSSKTLYTKTFKSFPACDMDSNDEYRPYHTNGSSRNGPYQPNTCSRKANGTNLPFFLHHRCRREKNSYTLSKSQLLYEATTSIGIGRKKNETEIPVFFFFWFLGKMLSLVLRIVHWVDKDALGIGTLTVGCTTLELPHVFPLKSFDQKISIF